MNLAPVTLAGDHVRLEPLSLAHLDGLTEAGLDPEIWRLNPSRVTSREEMAAYIQSALDAQAAKTALPFATIHRASNEIVGSTRFANIDTANRHVEIGWTWIAPEFQRTMVNTEAKLLMLRYAFENLGCLRVELKTDTLNRRSRNAIQRIGAVKEGIFRNHVITWTGRIRHSIWFSITNEEWPRVKANLEAKLTKPSPPHRRVETLSDTQIEDLHRLFQSEWWTQGRTLDDIRRMLDNTPVIVGFVDPKTARLIAFARAITDGIYKALILDVIVEESQRKTGMGKQLMDAIISHPMLENVQHLELYCRPDLVPFYARWAFQEVPADLKFLRKG